MRGRRKGGQVAVFPAGRRRPGGWPRKLMYQSARFAAPRRRFVRRTSTPARRPPVESSSRCGLREPRQVSQLRNHRLAGGGKRAALGFSRLLRPRVTRLRSRPSIPNALPSVTPTESGASLQSAKGKGVAAIVDADAPTRRAGAEREAPASRQREPEDGNRQPAGPPVRAAADAIEAPDVSARSDSGSDSSLRNESFVTLGREAGSATVGSGSTEPGAERATGRSERSSSAACAKTVMASPEAPALSDGGSGSPVEREVVEMSTAGATDSQAHRLVAFEPGGTEAANPAGGCTPSDSASSSDSGSSGNTPPAVQDRTSGDADSSADPPPLSPAPAAVAGREAADAHAEGVAVATAAETACDTDVELRRRLGELRSAAARLGAVSRVGPPSSFEATCGLVEALVAAMERCLEAGLEEQAMLAGLPADLVRRLDAHLSNETVMAASTRQTGDADGRGRGSAPPEQASNPRAWLKKRFGI